MIMPYHPLTAPASPRKSTNAQQRKWIALLGLVLLSLIASSSALAAVCKHLGGNFVTLPALTPPANAKRGDIIGSPSGYTFTRSGLVCTYKASRETINVMAAGFNGFNTGYKHQAGVWMNVYSTGIPGVGYALKSQVNSQPVFAMDAKSFITIWNTTSKPTRPSFTSTIYFIVTGPITGGTIESLNLGSFHLREDVAKVGWGIVANDVTILAPLKPTCRVTTPSVSLPLGRITKVRFSGVGSHAGSATQNISLNCSGGGGSTRDILMTVTDRTNPANRTNVLSLTPASGAQGVALQLLHKSHLIRYGADSATIGNTNQWLTGSTGNGTYTIPITARYIQTGREITSGTANGLATFTMAYR